MKHCHIGFLAFYICVAAAQAQADDTLTISVVGTNDVHGRVSSLPIFGGYVHNLRKARRQDGALTVMVINLSLEEKRKTFRIGEQAQVQAEIWLFDLTHRAENMGMVEISGEITVPPQSASLYIVRE